MPKQTFGLGRGLGSLIPGRKTEAKPTATPATVAPADRQAKKGYFSSVAFGSRAHDGQAARPQIIQAPIADIISNRHQPRQYFPDRALQELAASIKEHGILQPLVVAPQENGNGYELIAGERRLRAARLAGLKEVPVIIRRADELEKLELALVENIQRADLNLIEEAEAYQKLNDEFGLTQDQIAKRVGKARPTVTNTIRLLALPGEVQQALSEGQITIGHAKRLLEIKDTEKQLALFRQVLQQKLTITDTFGEVQRIQVKRHSRHIRKDPDTVALEDNLRRALGTKVYIRRRGKNGGEIVIEYYGEEELRALMGKLAG